jgi:polygalacturonase
MTRLSPSALSSDCTSILQQAIDAGGEVHIPPGIWTCGALVLRSNLTLELAPGTVLRAIEDPAAFPHREHPYPSRMDRFPWRAFLFGCDLDNITLCGQGRIECGGEHAGFTDGVGDSPDRPYGLHLVNCRNVRVQGLSFHNSAHWMMRYFRCENVAIEGVSVFNHANQNNDGMDIDSCRDVQISRCVVDSSDDGICLKSECELPCRDVVVERCRISSHASAIKLGTASIGGFENIVYRDCDIVPSRATTMHHPFQLWNGMTGIDIAGVDGGALRNLRFEDIRMEGVLNPIFVKLGNRDNAGNIPPTRKACDAKPGPLLDPSRRCMDGLVFERIAARAVGPLPSILCGYEGHPIRTVQLRDVEINVLPPTPSMDPTAEPDWNSRGYPCAVCVAGTSDMGAYGFVLRHVEGLHMENVRVTPARSDPRTETIFADKHNQSA